MDRKKAIALSFSVPFAWGFSYPLMKIGMDSMNATSIVALRCIIAFAACLVLFHKRAFRINRDLMVRAAIIGASWQPSSPACAWAPASPRFHRRLFAEP